MSAGQPPILCPESISADGSRDVRADLQDWLRNLPEGRTGQLALHGYYKVIGSIKLPNWDHRTLLGNGATWDWTTFSYGNTNFPRPQLWILDAEQAAVVGLKVRSTNKWNEPGMPTGYGRYEPRNEQDHGFRFERCVTPTIRKSTADAVFGDGVQFLGCKDAFAEDVVVDRNGRQGVSYTDCRGFTARRVTIAHGRRAGFDLENDIATQTIDDGEISECTIRSWHPAFAAEGRGQVSNINIHDNLIEGTGLPLLKCRNNDTNPIRRKGWRFAHNRVTRYLGSPAAALLWVGTDDIEVVGNTIPLVTTQSRKAVEFQSCGGTLEVKENGFENASASYHADAATSPVDACGNRLTQMGNFDQPESC